MRDWYNWDFNNAFQYFHITQSDNHGYCFMFEEEDNGDPCIGQLLELNEEPKGFKYKYICAFKFKSWKH